MPMMKYNKILETEKYTFVCEPWVPNGVNEEKLNKDKDKEIQDMLEKFKNDTLNKPDNGKHEKTTPNIFDNLGIREPKGLEV